MLVLIICMIWLKKLTCLHHRYIKFLGAGANSGESASINRVEAVNVAKECLLAALKAEPKAAHIWANLANAYYMTCDHRSASKCLEKVLMAYC